MEQIMGADYGKLINRGERTPTV